MFKDETPLEVMMSQVFGLEMTEEDILKQPIVRRPLLNSEKDGDKKKRATNRQNS